MAGKSWSTMPPYSKYYQLANSLHSCGIFHYTSSTPIHDQLKQLEDSSIRLIMIISSYSLWRSTILVSSPICIYCGRMLLADSIASDLLLALVLAVFYSPPLSTIDWENRLFSCVYRRTLCIFHGVGSAITITPSIIPAGNDYYHYPWNAGIVKAWRHFGSCTELWWSSGWNWLNSATKPHALLKNFSMLNKEKAYDHFAVCLGHLLIMICISIVMLGALSVPASNCWPVWRSTHCF